MRASEQERDRQRQQQRHTHRDCPNPASRTSLISSWTGDNLTIEHPQSVTRSSLLFVRRRTVHSTMWTGEALARCVQPYLLLEGCFLVPDGLLACSIVCYWPGLSLIRLGRITAVPLLSAVLYVLFPIGFKESSALSLAAVYCVVWFGGSHFVIEVRYGVAR